MCAGDLPPRRGTDRVYLQSFSRWHAGSPAIYSALRDFRATTGADYQAARIECDRAGAGAGLARFRMQLIVGRPGLMTLADSAFDALGPIRRIAFGEEEPVNSASKEEALREVREHETDFESAVKEFIDGCAGPARPAGLR